MVWMECRSCSHRFLYPVPEDMESWYETDGYRMTTHNSTDPLVNLQEETQRAQRLSQWIDKPLSHLDIGSSTGALLRTVGAEIQVGVELSHNRRSSYEFKSFKNLDQVNDFYELITCIQTLEHVIDPVRHLRLIYKSCLSYCLIEVPVEGIYYPHLHRFNIEGLQDMMSSIGFAVQVLELTESYYLLRGDI